MEDTDMKNDSEQVTGIEGAVESGDRLKASMDQLDKMISGVPTLESKADHTLTEQIQSLTDALISQAHELDKCDQIIEDHVVELEKQRELVKQLREEHTRAKRSVFASTVGGMVGYVAGRIVARSFGLRGWAALGVGGVGSHLGSFVGRVVMMQVDGPSDIHSISPSEIG